MSELPGGIDRAHYQWPHVSSLLTDQDAVVEMDVHAVRDQEGGSTLIAFLAATEDGGRDTGDRTQQVDVVADMARDLGAVIEQLVESDISDDTIEQLARSFHSKPDTGVLVVGGRWWR
jgi:hypothetical protein